MNRMFCLMLCCMVLVIGCSSQNKEANKLYVEALKLYDADKYKVALQKLETIVEQYPKSDLAVNLMSGETRIGDMTFRGFRDEYMPAYLATIDIQAISLALDMYAVTTGSYPTTEQGLDALLNEPSTSPKPKNWSGPYAKVKNTKFLDPSGNPYKYRLPSTREGHDYDLYSVGPDGEEGGGDDITSW